MFKGRLTTSLYLVLTALTGMEQYLNWRYVTELSMLNWWYKYRQPAHNHMHARAKYPETHTYVTIHWDWDASDNRGLAKYVE